MKEYYEFLINNNITPNGVCVLYSIYTNTNYSDKLNNVHEKYKLELLGYLKLISRDNMIYEITDEGLHLLKESEMLFNNKKPMKKTEMPFSDWEENIIKYNNMFPTGKKQGSSVSFRTNPKELYERFKWFFKEYPEYTWEDIFKSVELYLIPFDESNDYTYAQTSKYFIKKSDKNNNTTSTLATMCYNISIGNTEELNNGYHYFG